MDILEIIMSGDQNEALNALIKQVKAEKKEEDLKQLFLLKSNLKKTKRENRLGLITREQHDVIVAKTNQYMIDYVQGDGLEIDHVELQPKFSGVIKNMLLFTAGIVFLFSVGLFYLRRDILEQLIKYQDFDVDVYLLFLPAILFFSSIYLFFKIKNHA